MSMRVLSGSLIAATVVAGTDASAGEFVQIESGTKAESSSCTAAAASTVR